MTEDLPFSLSLCHARHQHTVLSIATIMTQYLQYSRDPEPHAVKLHILMRTMRKLYESLRCPELLSNLMLLDTDGLIELLPAADWTCVVDFLQVFKDETPWWRFGKLALVLLDTKWLLANADSARSSPSSQLGISFQFSNDDSAAAI